MKIKNRILVFALALMMLLSALPLFAFAEEGSVPVAEGDFITDHGLITKEEAEGMEAALYVKSAGQTDYTRTLYSKFFVNGKGTDGSDATAAMDKAYKLLTNNDVVEDVYIYLLADVSYEKATTVDFHKYGQSSLTLDLGGHTLTDTVAPIYYQTATTYEGESKITVKNGTIKYSQYVLNIAYKGNSSYSETTSVTFDDIIFTPVNPNDTSKASIVNTGHVNTLTKNQTVVVNFNNCTVSDKNTNMSTYFRNIGNYVKESGHEVATGVFAKIIINCDHNEIKENGHCVICGEDLNPKINEISGTVSADLSLNYYTDIPEEDMENYILEIDGETLSPYIKNGKVAFTFAGIGPQQIGEKFVAKLYRGEVLCDTKEKSVQDYLKSLYAEETAKDADKNESLMNLVVAILVYGQEAEKYLGLEETITLPDGVSAPTLGEIGELAISVNGNNQEAFIYSAGVKFDTVNKIFFKIFASEAPTGIKLNGAEVEATLEGEYYVVYTDGIAPDRYDNGYTLVLSNGATVTYSVNVYTYRMQGNELFGALAKALYNYGLSCEAYVNPKA